MRHRLAHRSHAVLAAAATVAVTATLTPSAHASTPSAPAVVPAASTSAVTFADTTTNPFRADIAWLADQEVTTGYRVGAQTYYKPFDAINRDQMAAFIYRMQGRMAYSFTSSAFADVSATSPFAKEMNFMYAAGYSTGWVNGTTRTYRPLDGVTRGQFAAFIYRMDNPTYTAPTTSPFADLKPSDPFYAQICYLASIGVTTGWVGADGKRTFRPTEVVRRDTMAAFIHRYFAQPVFAGRDPRSFRSLWATIELADLVTTEVNPDREAQGLAPWIVDDTATTLASAHAGTMAVSGALAPSPDVASSQWQGVNAAEQDAHEAATGLLQAYLAEPDARARLFSARGQYLGLGLARDTKARWWTSLEVFTTSPVLAAVAGRKRTAGPIDAMQATAARLAG